VIAPPARVPKGMRRKPLYAPLEEAWLGLEDAIPRHLVFAFHSYLRDWEIANRVRANPEQRHRCFLTFARSYPECLEAYRKVFGHITS